MKVRLLNSTEMCLSEFVKYLPSDNLYKYQIQHNKEQISSKILLYKDLFSPDEAVTMDTSAAREEGQRLI